MPTWFVNSHYDYETHAQVEFRSIGWEHGDRARELLYELRPLQESQRELGFIQNNLETITSEAYQLREGEVFDAANDARVRLARISTSHGISWGELGRIDPTGIGFDGLISYDGLESVARVLAQLTQHVGDAVYFRAKELYGGEGSDGIVGPRRGALLPKDAFYDALQDREESPIGQVIDWEFDY